MKMRIFALPLLLVAAAVFLSGCIQQPAGTTTTTTTIGITATTTSTTVPNAATTTTTAQALQTFASVAIQNFAFSPQTVHIATGGTVTWTNEDSATHNIVSDTGSEISSPSLATGQQYSHTFTEDLTYTYHCGIHPSMTGTVVVGS